MIRRAVARAIAVVCALGLGAEALAQQVPFETVVGNLRVPDPKEKIRALQQLSEGGFVQAAVPVSELLADERPEVQVQAIATLLDLYLVRRPVKATRIGFRADYRNGTVAESAFEAGPLATLPHRVVPEVLTRLAAVTLDNDQKVRVNAAFALGVVGAPAMGPFPETALSPVTASLLQAMRHDDPVTREAAVRAVGRIFARGATKTPHAAGDALITAMNDPDRRVRLWAMEALGWQRYDRAVQALTERFDFYRTGPEAQAALHGLARIGHPLSAEIFRRQLDHKNTAYRVIAIEGLGRVGDPKDVRTIEVSAQGQRQPEVQLARAFALVKLGDVSGYRTLVDALASQATEQQARAYLLECGGNALESLHRATQSADALMRAHAAQLVGVLGGQPDIAVLQPLVQDRDPMVAEVAVQALLRIRTGLESGTRPAAPRTTEAAARPIAGR